MHHTKSCRSCLLAPSVSTNPDCKQYIEGSAVRATFSKRRSEPESRMGDLTVRCFRPFFLRSPSADYDGIIEFNDHC